MGGLLYKDFVSMKGKRFLYLWLGATVLFIAARILFPGTAAGTVVMDAGRMKIRTTGDFRDVVLGGLFPLEFLLIGLMLCFNSYTTIIEADEKSKIVHYLKALPVGRNGYIASKYLFVAIYLYVIISMETLWYIIYRAGAGEGTVTDILDMLASMLPSFAGIVLLIAAVELPFMITFGVKKAAGIKTALLLIVLFAGFAFMLFGDMTLLERFNLFEWMEEHQFLMTVVQVADPVVTLCLFYLSYRITCRINRNREAEVDG